MWDELPSGPERRGRPRFWPRSISEAGAATATFLLSAAVFSVAGLNALRGPEIDVLQADVFYLYRDGQGDRSELLLAVPVQIINEASRDYGDVLTNVRASFDGGRKNGAWFEVETLVDDVFTLSAEKDAAQCAIGSRCIAATGHLFIERNFELLDVNGAASRTEQLGFILSDNQCTGAQTRCAEFASYAAATRTLAQRRPVRLDLRLEFNNDGRKELTCVSTRDPKKLAAIFAYLETRRWTTIRCETAS